jgi:hypothetical protein
MKRLAILSMLLIPTLAFSAIYKIDGTKEYVNGIPTGLSTAERAMLKVIKTQSMTDADCKESFCLLLDKPKAKERIKAINASGTVEVDDCMMVALSFIHKDTNKLEKWIYKNGKESLDGGATWVGEENTGCPAIAE